MVTAAAAASAAGRAAAPRPSRSTCGLPLLGSTSSVGCSAHAAASVSAPMTLPKRSPSALSIRVGERVSLHRPMSPASAGTHRSADFLPLWRRSAAPQDGFELVTGFGAAVECGLARATGRRNFVARVGGRMALDGAARTLAPT
jgi:hypothetical protein